MSNATRARLRTKTGCLTCRQRRKKCDEKLPVCEGCSTSGRKCSWPSSSDLLDRRFSSHDWSRHQTPSPRLAKLRRTQSPERSLQVRNDREDIVTVPAEWQPTSESDPKVRFLAEAVAAHGVISRDLQIVLSRHFVERYYGLLLLPCCHLGFYNGWLTEIQHLMLSHKSLYFSVLACAASHIHLSDESTPMQGLALTYYTNATRELSSLLNSTPGLANHNGLLMSVMLLYLHGCMGWGTYTDIPMHLNAATRILTLRLLDRSITIDHLFDRLAVESVLYQIFLVTTGLWTQSAGSDYDFDPEFWSRCEDLLDRLTFFPGRSTSFNSPVLGVPASLFRLALTLRSQYRCRIAADPEALLRMRGEVEDCEASLLCELDTRCRASANDDLTREEVYYRDARCLYGIIVSLMFEQLARPGIGIGPPQAEPRETWQVRKAIQILRRHENVDGWSKCYIGNWPVYTLGFFMSSAEDQRVIRAELQRRWELTNFAQVARFLRDLEKTWAER